MKKYQYLYVGTYTDYEMGDREKSKGIYLLELNMETGELTHKSVEEGTVNPSFLAITKNKEYLYAVNETDNYDNEGNGSVTCYKIDHTPGQLTLADQKSSLGKHPCHIAINDKNQLFIANYTSGSIATYNSNGSPSNSEHSVIVHTGRSINKDRQASPHTHSCIISPDQKYVFAVDLGIDKIMAYKINEDASLTPAEVPYYESMPGNGPRFGVFHPTLGYLYIANELTSTIDVLSYNNETAELKTEQTISNMDEQTNSLENTGSDIRITPNGKFLFASNRGENTIVSYEIDPETGLLTYVDRTSSLGRTPRNFTIDETGTFLIAANQDSDRITVYRIDQNTGRLTPISGLNIPIPVCICQL